MVSDEKPKKRRGRPPKKPPVEDDGTLPWDKNNEEKSVPWESATVLDEGGIYYDRTKPAGN